MNLEGVDPSRDEEHQNGDMLEIPDIPIPQPRREKTEAEALSPASRGGDNISGHSHLSDTCVGGTTGQQPSSRPKVSLTSSKKEAVLAIGVEGLQLGQGKQLPIIAMQSDVELVNNSLVLQQPSVTRRVRKILPKSPPVVVGGGSIDTQRSLSEVENDPQSMEVVKTSGKDRNLDDTKSRRPGLRLKRPQSCVKDGGSGEEPEEKKPKIHGELLDEGKMKVKKTPRKRQV